MKRKIFVLFSWTSLGTLEFLVFVANVIISMTGNKSYLTPKVTMTDLQAGYDRLKLAYPDRKKGPDEKQEYENAYAALDKLMHSEAGYVNEIADGDAAMIISAGFIPSSGIAVSAVTPANPGIVKLTPSLGGNLEMELAEVIGAVSYLYILCFGATIPKIQITEDGLIFPPMTNSFMVIPDGNMKEHLTGLEPGMHVWVQALAQNAAGKSKFGSISDCFLS